MYPGTGLISTLRALNVCVCIQTQQSKNRPFILTALRDCHYYYPPSTDEKAEAQEGEITWPKVQVRHAED